MSGGREQVLASIRRSLRRAGPLDDTVRRSLETRTSAPRAGIKPHYTGDPVDRFVAKLRSASGLVTRVADLAGVASTVEAHVERVGAPFELVVAPDPALDAVPWSNRFRIERRAARGSDRVSVTGCFAGVGETGTVVLLSGPTSPTTLNFLPEDHVVVLDETRIVRHLEDVWVHLRSEIGDTPRTVNMISGPSKTADVAQTMQEGAHGPRRLHVVLVAPRAA